MQSFQLQKADAGLLKESLRAACESAIKSYSREAVGVVLDLIDDGEAGAGTTPQQLPSPQDLAEMNVASGSGVSVSELASQVAAALQRVAALRKGVVVKMHETFSAELFGQRPILHAAEPAAEPSPGCETVMIMPQSSNGGELCKRLTQAVDKLPAIRARMDEVNRRVGNVLSAIKEQDAYNNTQTIRLISPLRRAPDSAWVVGVIARTANS